MASYDDYEMSYDEYIKSQNKNKEEEKKPVHAEKTEKSEKKEQTEKSQSIASEESETSEDSKKSKKSKKDKSGKADGNTIINTIKNIGMAPVAVVRKAVTVVASKLGIPSWAIALAFAMLSIPVAGLLTAGQKNPAVYMGNEDYLMDPLPAIVNEEYVWANQQQKDINALSMFRVLSSDAITLPFVEDSSLATSDGLYYYPEDRAFERYNPYDGSEYVATSHGFTPEAIIGMLSHSHAEGAIEADGFEYNFGVGPIGDDDADDILSASHHVGWDIYVSHMFDLYDQQNLPIIEDTYKYKEREYSVDDDRWVLSDEEHLYPGLGFWGFTGAFSYELQEFCDTFEDVWDLNLDGHNDAMYTQNGQLAFLLYVEDWFDYLDEKQLPNQVGYSRKFPVEVPVVSAVKSELGIDVEDDDTIYQICQKIYEKMDEEERDLRAYSDRQGLKDLQKQREDWDKKIDKVVTTEKVNAKEWAVLSVIHYDFYNWVYYPENKLDDKFKYGDVPHAFQATAVTDWVADPYEYTKYVLDAKNINNLNDDEFVYLLNSRYTKPVYKAVEDEEFALYSMDNIPDTDATRDEGYHLDKQAGYELFPEASGFKYADKVIGEDSAQQARRQSSLNPIPFDHHGFDKKQDFETATENDIDKIWNDTNFDYWDYDVHVECIARDRFGRIIDKRSIIKNIPEVASKGGVKVVSGNNGWNKSVVERQHTENINNKVVELEKGDDIRIESRSWNDEDFKKWYDAFESAYKAEFTRQLGIWAPQVFDALKYHCCECDSADEINDCHNKEGTGHCDTCPYVGLHDGESCPAEGCDGSGEDCGCDDCEDIHWLTCDCDSGDPFCSCEYNSTSHETHDTYAKYLAGFIANDIAISKALKAAENVAQEINKELRFDVLADYGVDMMSNDVNSVDDTTELVKDGDEDSDQDGTSVGGLVCETLAADWEVYFAGMPNDDGEMMQSHLFSASHYFEIYTGTQEEWYRNGGDEQKHSSPTYTCDDMPHIDENTKMWYRGNRSLGRSALDYYIGDNLNWWKIDNKDTYESHDTGEYAGIYEKWKYPEKYIWTTNNDLAEAVTGLFDREADEHYDFSQQTINKQNSQPNHGLRLDISDIQTTAVQLCWAQGYPSLATFNTDTKNEDGNFVQRLCTEVYVRVKDILYPAENPADIEPGVEKNALYSSCDRGAATILRASGADPFFPWAFPDKQLEYCEKSDLWYDVLNDKVFFKGDDAGMERKTLETKEDLDKLQPGDVLIRVSKGGDDPDSEQPEMHIAIFVGGDTVLTKYPDLDFGEWCKTDKKMKYEIWFSGLEGRYSIVHSSAATMADVQKFSADYSRGLMLQRNGDEWLLNNDYRVFRCRNGDMKNSIGGKWTVNEHWAELRNCLKGEIRDEAFMNMVTARGTADRLKN